MVVSESSILQGKRAAYFTLGCKLNFAETSAIAQALAAEGVSSVRKGEHADICIVNTCSVTEVADHKCRQAIHKMVRQHPGALVVVTGCYAQLKPQEVAAIEGVSLVLDQDKKGRVVDIIKEYLASAAVRGKEMSALQEDVCFPVFVPSCSRGERTRYFLKVQDGCNYFCTYCTIPFARGRSRNGSIESLVDQARQAASEGGK